MKKITPKTANTINKIVKIKMDNVSTRNSWISISPGTVCICNQKNGEEGTGVIVLTKKEFERFIKFYETGK